MKVLHQLGVVVVATFIGLLSGCASMGATVDSLQRPYFDVESTAAACAIKPALKPTFRSEALPVILLADLAAQAAGAAVSAGGSWLKDWADKFNATYSAELITGFYSIKSAPSADGKDYPANASLNVNCITANYVTSNDPKAPSAVSFTIAVVEGKSSEQTHFMFLQLSQLAVNRFVSNGSGPKDLVIKVHMDFIDTSGKSPALKGIDFVIPAIEAVKQGDTLGPQDLAQTASNIQPLPTVPSLGTWKCTNGANCAKDECSGAAPQKDAKCEFFPGPNYSSADLGNFVPTAITVTVAETDKGWGSKIASALAAAVTGSKDQVVKDVQTAGGG